VGHHHAHDPGDFSYCHTQRLEMAINLLQEMPEQAIETVYAFM